MLRLLAAATFMASCAIHASTDNPETLIERSQTAARAVLDRAVSALGGIDGLRAIEVVRIQVEGEYWPRLQLSTPEPPFDGGTVREDVLLDIKNRRLRFEQHDHTPGFSRPEVIVVADGEGSIYALEARLFRSYPSTRAAEQQLASHYRRLPHLLLLQALDRADTLRFLGQETFEGRLHDVFTFVTAEAQQVALYVQADNALVSKYEASIVDPLTGEDVVELIFSDYAAPDKTSDNTKGNSRGDTLTPRRLLIREAGAVTTRAQVAIDINPAVTTASFAGPADFTRVGPSRTLPEQVEQLADGVFVIQNIAGPTQNTLAVEFKDYIVAIEAPGSSAGAERVIARIKATIPGKPIRYVAMTHHHGDHIGGLRGYIAEGATVITTPGNRKVVETMAAAPHNDRLAKQPRPPQILFTARGKHVLTDGTRRLELIDVGPNSHAREMLIAYLPKERIVFQADMFQIPTNETPLGPLPERYVSFANKLRGLRLRVDRIASVHGRTVTIAEYRQKLNESGFGATGDTR
jgi:glyoxylase-like metal-dependent hydrolase (beta-lactamase superfamily II)